MVRLAGEQETVKSGTGAAVTFSVRPALWLSAPLVPCAWIGYDPGVVPPETVTVRVLPIDPPAGGVAGLGEKLQEAPAGRLAQARLTASAKLFTELTVQVVLPAWPCWMLRLDGLQLSVKSGLALATGVALTQVPATP